MVFKRDGLQKEWSKKGIVLKRDGLQPGVHLDANTKGQVLRGEGGVVLKEEWSPIT